MNNSRHLVHAMFGAAALSLVLTASAAAQMPAPSFSLEKDQHKTPEQIEHDKAIDNAYRSATKKIPDPISPNDPWATVRPTPPAAAAKKPTKKQQVSEGAKKSGE